jgi:hypothetical protein
LIKQISIVSISLRQGMITLKFIIILVNLTI